MSNEELAKFRVSERSVLRKFRQTEQGLKLYEALVIQDGKITEVWTADSKQPPPED